MFTTTLLALVSSAAINPKTPFVRPLRGEPGCFMYPGLANLSNSGLWSFPDGWGGYIGMYPFLPTAPKMGIPPNCTGLIITPNTNGSVVIQVAPYMGKLACIGLGRVGVNIDLNEGELNVIPGAEPIDGVELVFSNGSDVSCGVDRSVVMAFRCDPASTDTQVLGVAGGCAASGYNGTPAQYAVEFVSPLACPTYEKQNCPPRTTPTPREEGILALAPAPPAPAGTQLFRNTSWPSWGGTIVPGVNGDTDHHLFAAGFHGSDGSVCGLDGWKCNGVVLHAVSKTGPAGPYSFSDVALPAYQHNPHAILHPDGTYLLFGIGQANTPNWTVPCVDETPVGVCEGPTTHCQLHTSKSPYGPWEVVKDKNTGADHIFINNNANPAPYIFPNGSLIVMTCGNNIWYADHWSGPYTEIHTLPFTEMNLNRTDKETFCNKGAGCSGNTTCKLWTEDPFIYFDKKGSFWRVLLHQYTSCVSPGDDRRPDIGERLANGDYEYLKYVGGYARSKTADLFGEWEYSFDSMAYGSLIDYTNGVESNLAGRERPKIYFENDEPKLLTNGVRFNPDPNQTNVFTFVQPISGWYDDDN